MLDFAIFWDWAGFAVRWLHVVTAMVWIGTSFYFIALDLGLVRRPGMPEGVTGEEWQVHGGGFYHVEKYAVAPERLPEELTWFKWESYATWLSGAALLMILYWAGAELYLIDRAKADLSVFQAVLLSAGSIALGWLIYDGLCRSPLGHRPVVLMLVLFAVIVAMSWGLNQIFTGRAALLHLGAFTATIMTANVFLVIMPNQRIVVGDLKSGRVPDPEYGRIAKLRSTHNNYLTLPVIFLMLSNHYPLAFGTPHAWAIGALVFLMGVTIRHYFNTMHARKGRPNWTWAATAVLFVAIVWLSALPGRGPAPAEAALPETGAAARFAEAPGFEDAHGIVLARCAMCHAREPLWQGLHWAPKGVALETEADVARQARAIFLQAGVSHAMPPGNLTYMTEEERRALTSWYRAGAGG